MGLFDFLLDKNHVLIENDLHAIFVQYCDEWAFEIYPCDKDYFVSSLVDSITDYGKLKIEMDMSRHDFKLPLAKATVAYCEKCAHVDATRFPKGARWLLYTYKAMLSFLATEKNLNRSDAEKFYKNMRRHL